jgi:Rnl2 family RNA ligase
MEFKRYNSLINHYRSDDLAKWLLYNPEIRNENFVVTEKLHGAHFQMYISSSGEVTYGKRSSFLGNNADFYDYQSALKEENISRFIKSMIKYCSLYEMNLLFLGELFGGNVQKEVYYGKEKKIRFYDVYDIDETKYWSPVKAFTLFCDNHVNVPVLDFCCSFDEAMNYSNAFISTLTPDDYPNKESNICEGIVIKPYKVYMYGEEYFVIKSKNEKFSEKKSHTKKINKDNDTDFVEELRKEGIGEEIIELESKARELVNKNRLNNVISHNGPLTNPKQITEYMKLFMEDYQKDLKKENNEMFDELERNYTSTDIKKINRILFSRANRDCIDLIKEHIMNGGN